MRVELEPQLGDERLPAEVETTLYRIVQEALTNIVKHAEATNVSILLIRRNATATVVIEDDGRGFDPDHVREDGAGLLGMRERVELHDGRLTIESVPGSGTTLVAEVPV
jgi:signal transduction histidine kinase